MPRGGRTVARRPSFIIVITIIIIIGVIIIIIFGAIDTSRFLFLARHAGTLIRDSWKYRSLGKE